MDIQQFLKNLSNYARIDFQGKESEFEALSKYDKNKNSIFEADELQTIRNDLIYHAQADGNSEDLSEEEAQSFLRSLLKEGQSFADLTKDKPINEYVENLLKQFNTTISKNNKENYIKNVRPDFAEDMISIFSAEFTDEEFEKIKPILYIENREKQFNISDFIKLVMLNKEGFELAKTLFYVENREDQFNAHEITQLANLNKEEFECAKTLFYVENREKQFDAYEITQLTKLNNEEFERAKILFYVKNREKQFNAYEITQLAKLNNEEFERAETLFYVKNREKQFNVHEIVVLAQLNSEEFERAKTLFYVENREEQFDVYGIAKLAKLNENNFEHAKKLFHIDDREKDFCGQEIAELSKLNEFELKVFFKCLDKFSMNFNDATMYSLNYNPSVDKFLEKLKGELKVLYVTYDFINYELIENEKSSNYTCYYDNNKIIEIIKKEDIYNYNDDKQIKITITNYNNNIKHEILNNSKVQVSELQDVDGLKSEKLTYFDNEGNMLKTVQMERDNNGMLRVAETDKDGKTRPIQWESIDSETGAKITERHLTSPEGVKTEFYAEESDDLKITEYKIVDRDGKPLIDIYQTFQQVSDNKFISSINTTGNDEDTQVYEMEYTEDYKVRIFDKKNNKTTEIDLMQYFNTNESAKKLFPTVKQLPGQVLLEFAEKQFTIGYDHTFVENGSWQPETKLLSIGNYDESIGGNNNILATFTHELGHYLDLYNTNNGIFSSNPNILNIYKEELELFQKNTTTAQAEYLDYFIGDESSADKGAGDKEKIAETHSIMYSINQQVLNIRRFYLAQYFPRTMAAIMKLLLEEEGVIAG